MESDSCTTDNQFRSHIHDTYARKKSKPRRDWAIQEIHASDDNTSMFPNSEVKRCYVNQFQCDDDDGERTIQKGCFPRWLFLLLDDRCLLVVVLCLSTSLSLSCSEKRDTFRVWATLRMRTFVSLILNYIEPQSLRNSLWHHPFLHHSIHSERILFDIDSVKSSSLGRLYNPQE